jgi:hypothetical protein
MGSVCKNGFLRACEIQFSESRQEGVSHLNIALFSSVMRRGSSFEGLVWLSALFFVQRDARQSRSLMIEWPGCRVFPSASASKNGRMCVPSRRLVIIKIKCADPFPCLSGARADPAARAQMDLISNV